MSYVISPHLDDAVLSLGQMMSASPSTIITVFAGDPPEGIDLSPYDDSCGFRSSKLAMEARRQEDLRAAAILQCNAIHWEFSDGQYGVMPDKREIAARLKKLMSTNRGAFFVPLGLVHPDHRTVATCALAAWQTLETPRDLFIYEELPYRVLQPAEAVNKLEDLRAMGVRMQEYPYPLEAGDLTRKRDAIARYASQFPAGAVDPCLSVPERAWKVWK